MYNISILQGDSYQRMWTDHLLRKLSNYKMKHILCNYLLDVLYIAHNQFSMTKSIGSNKSTVTNCNHICCKETVSNYHA